MGAGSLFCRLAVPLALLAVFSLPAGGCVLFFGERSGPPLYSGRQVPAEVFDAEALALFMRSGPDPAPATSVTVSPEGRVEPGGELLPGDYQPESHAEELLRRLDLRTFPSLLFAPRGDVPVTHDSPAWSDRLMEKTDCTLSASYADVTYRVVAAFDYEGKGSRDWLVLSTEQLSQAEGLVLVLWLLVKNPQATGLLSARLLGVEEWRGLGKTEPVMRADAAEKRIADLRAALNLPPLPSP